MGLFGRTPPPDPRKQVREWGTKLRKQSMLLDRQVRSIQREEDKVKLSLKEAAKKGDADVCKILAKELLNSRKAIARILSGQAQLNSIQLQLNAQVANIKVSGAIQKSTEVLSCMNNLMKIAEISSVMQELSREMMKAGIIEEMMEETIDEVTGMDEEEMEEQVAVEVEKVLFEITKGQMGKMPSANKEPIASGSAEIEVPEDNEEIIEIEKRLQALKS